MIFHRSKIKTNHLKLTMYNQIIIETSSLKFLWVIIDNNLTWHEHKISKSIGIIYKIQNRWIKNGLLDG